MKRAMETLVTIGFVIGGILLLCAPEPVQVGKAHAVLVPKVLEQAVSGKRQYPVSPYSKNAFFRE